MDKYDLQAVGRTSMDSIRLGFWFVKRSSILLQSSSISDHRVEFHIPDESICQLSFERDTIPDHHHHHHPISTPCGPQSLSDG